MKQIVVIKLIVDEFEDNAGEIARANLFQASSDMGYDVLSSESRNATKQEISDAKAAALWD